MHSNSLLSKKKNKYCWPQTFEYWMIYKNNKNETHTYTVANIQSVTHTYISKRMNHLLIGNNYIYYFLSLTRQVQLGSIRFNVLFLLLYCKVVKFYSPKTVFVHVLYTLVFVWGRNYLSVLCVFSDVCVCCLCLLHMSKWWKKPRLSMARPPAEQLLARWRSSSALFSYHTDHWVLSRVSRTGLKARPWRTLYPSAHDRVLFASLLFHWSKVSFVAYIIPINTFFWVSTADHGSV